HHLSRRGGATAVRGRSERVESRPRRARQALHVHAGRRRGADTRADPAAGEDAVTRAAALVAALLLVVAGDVLARGGGRSGGRGGGGFARGGVAAAGSFGQRAPAGGGYTGHWSGCERQLRRLRRRTGPGCDAPRR